MARKHAQIKTTIWEDPDWIRLDQSAQHLYWTLISHKDLSYCGVVPYLPGRWAKLADGLTVAKLKGAARSLERGKYVVIDREMGELLIRSFVRHDNILARRNMGNACARALGNVHSQGIRDSVMHELARLWLESPELDGWAGFKDFDPEAFAMACAMASDMERSMA